MAADNLWRLSFFHVGSGGSDRLGAWVSPPAESSPDGSMPATWVIPQIQQVNW